MQNETLEQTLTKMNDSINRFEKAFEQLINSVKK